MILKRGKIRKYLKKRGWTDKIFADKIGVTSEEVKKLINGEKVCYETAKKFIYFFKAYKAQVFIDWGKLGIENPLDKKKEDYDEKL